MRAAPLRPALDADGFLSSPVGAYFAGSRFITWVHGPSLLGNVYVDRIDEGDLAQIAQLFSLPGSRRLHPPLRTVLDGRALGSFHLPQYEVIRGYAASFLPAYLPKVERLAIVRPPSGLTGAVVAGLYHDLLEPSGRARLFVDAAEAFAWLGGSDAAHAHAQVEALIADVLGHPHLVRCLRDLLAAASEGRTVPTLEQAALSLGVSRRTLQRTLRASGTSFRQMLLDARMDRLESLLAGSSTKLEALASDVGCRSAGHLCKTYRRLRGRTPGDYRVTAPPARRATPSAARPTRS